MTRILNENDFALLIEHLDPVKDEAYRAEFVDLYFLYRFVRENSIVSVLEFGGGWSTFSLALGLFENKANFGSKYMARVRDPNPFKLMTIDASSQWSEVTRKRLPAHLADLTTFHVAEPQLTLLASAGEYVSVFQDLPFFSPGMIYLDGPDSDQVSGEISGWQAVQPHSLPMAADVLLIESQLWPGTFLISDGRHGNARMLRRNLKRSWEFLTDMFGDRAILRLSEESLGPVSESALGIRLEAARSLRGKEAALP